MMAYGGGLNTAIICEDVYNGSKSWVALALTAYVPETDPFMWKPTRAA